MTSVKSAVGAETPIYMDYHSTTPVDPRVRDKMMPYLLDAFGNASSADHDFGREAEWAVREARQQVAKLVNASPLSVYFTSGTTESINLALQGYVRKHYAGTPLKVATLPLEHKAVLDTWDYLESRGWVELKRLSVNRQGQVDLNEIRELCAQGLSLLTVMGANNEIGTIYPVQEIAAIAQEHGVVYFCDASQYAGKIPVDFKGWGIGFLALTGHKMYGPKGTGALLIRKDVVIEPLLYGGGQQKRVRPGTLNVPGIVGLGEACRLRLEEMEADEARTAQLRDRLQGILKGAIPELQINGDLSARLAGNLHVSIPGIPNDALVAHFRNVLAISTGSACSSARGDGSHVTRSIGLPCNELQGCLRLGLGKDTTAEQIERAAELIIQAYQQLKTKLAS